MWLRRAVISTWGREKFPQAKFIHPQNAGKGDQIDVVGVGTPDHALCHHLHGNEHGHVFVEKPVHSLGSTHTSILGEGEGRNYPDGQSGSCL